MLERSSDVWMLDRLYEIIEKNLDNEQFGVDEFATELGVSRSQLHRKLHALNGQSPSQIIKEYRLNKAMELLQDNVATVAEVSYKVGFGSPSYFNTCFSDYFGYPPGEVKFRKKAGEVQKKPNSKRALLITAGILGILTLIYLGSSTLGFRKRSHDGAYNSIAVLPFENLSNDQQQDYFSNGIQIDILNNLSKIANLRVKSRSSTLQYRENRPATSQIGKDLGVQVVLEGSVQKVGDKVRIAAQLIDAKTDVKLWSAVYDRNLNSILKIQSELALEIAEVLKVKLTGKESELIVQSGTQDITAYDYLLRARQIRNYAKNEADYDNAIYWLQQAIELDDQFADAYVEIADILLKDKAEYGISQKLWTDSVFSLVNKTLALSPSHAYAHYLKSFLYDKIFYQPEKARKELEIAFKFGPNNPDILKKISQQLEAEGQFNASIEMKLKSIDLGPGRKEASYYIQWFWIYRQLNETDKALRNLQQAEKLAPNMWEVLLFSAFFYGDINYREKSIEYYKKGWRIVKNVAFLHHPGEYFLKLKEYDSAEYYFLREREVEKSYQDTTTILPYRPKLAYIYLKEGRKKEAHQLINESLTRRKPYLDGTRFDFWNNGKTASLFEMGEINVLLGKPEEAMDYFENPVSWQWGNVVTKYNYLKSYPLFELIKDNPRFKTLLQKSGNESRAYTLELRKIVSDREEKE